MSRPKWVRELTQNQTQHIITKLNLTPQQRADKALMEALTLTIESAGHVSPSRLGKLIRQTTVEHQRRQQSSTQHHPQRLLNPNDPLAQTLARLFAMTYTALLVELADENEEHKADDNVEEENKVKANEAANTKLELALETAPLLTAELSKLTPEQQQQLDRSLLLVVENNMSPRPQHNPKKGLSDHAIELSRTSSPAPSYEAKPESPTPFRRTPRPS